MDLFQLVAKLGLDTSEYEQGVKDALKDGEKLKDQFDDASESAKGMGDTFKGVLGANFVGDFLKSGADFAKQFASESISLASDLEEVQNVVDVTFGSDAQQIDRWSKKAKSAFGMGELAAKKYSGTIGAMLKSMGFTSEEVTNMSETLVQLTGDMASFYNLDHDTAFEKIRAGISGETEPLKQLGINMSVANLEAFASSKGFDVAYEKMTQAQQAALRYEYLLQTTVDAQGDFARTATGYANNVRLFQENIDSIKTSVGEKLIDIINPVLTELNEVLNGQGEGSLSATFTDIDKEFGSTVSGIEEKFLTANSLVGMLEELEEDGEVSADEQERWNRALKELVQTVPELSSVINLQTGEIEGGTEALRENIKAWYDNAIAQAKTLAMQEKYNAFVNELKNQADIEFKLEIAKGNEEQVGSKIVGIGQELAKAYGEEFDGSAKQAAELISRAWSPQLLQNLGYQISDVDNLVGSYNAESESVASLTEQLTKSKEETERARVEFEQYGEYIDRGTESLLGLTEATEGQSGASEKAAEVTELEANAYKKLETALQEIQDYRKQAVESARASLDSLAGGFDQIVDAFEGDEDAIKASLSDMFAGLEDQKQYFDNYASALQDAAEKGISEGLLAQLSDGSQQSAAYLKEINSATSDQIAQFNAKWQETEEAKNTLAQVMSDAQLAVDEEYQTMLTDAQELADGLVDAFDRGDDAKLSGLATAQGVADGLAEGEGEISARVSEINGLLGQLAAGSYAYVKAQAASIASGVAGPPAPKTSASNADGLTYVPYNDYLSYLHKGEAVLTAAQAEDWRAGRASSAPAAIDYAALGRAVASAITGLSVQMDGQTVGHIVAPTVSADIAEGSRTTRRYAMA